MEYWPPCAVWFAAFTLQSALDLPVEEVPTAKTRRVPQQARGQRSKKLATALLVSSLVAALVYQTHEAYHWITTPTAADNYRQGTQWLAQRASRGSTIFNVSWDDFPILFYYDDTHAYVSGLDPIYLSDHSPDLGQLYERIAAGRQSHPGESIRQAFGAEYVFLTLAANHNFYVAAMLSGEFTKVYEDKQCMVLKVRDLDFSGGR
jgi:hypothetical protein